jgi:hypothetical protein
MIHEAHRQLLTAYVDGELTARGRRRVVRLLRRSREARHLLRRLQRDAQALRSLRVPALAVDLSERVVQTISDRGLKPGVRRPARLPARKRYPAWVGLAAAAAVFVVVSFGSYLFFSSGPLGSDGSGQAAVHRPTPTPKEQPEERPTRGSQEGEANHEVVRQEVPPVLVGPEKPLIEKPVPPHEPIVRVPAEDEDPRLDPPAPEKKPDAPVLTAGGSIEMDRLERVELVLPQVVKLEQLEALAAREKLAAQLAKSPAYRIEVLCRDASRAVDRLRPILHGRKIDLTVESLAHARLTKKPAPKSDFALFLENVAPADLVEVLHLAGVEDRKAATRKPGEGRLDGAVVFNPLSRFDRRELVDLLGIDPTRVRPREPAPASSIDIRKPLSEGTRTQVENALDGKGPARPGAVKSPNTALLVPLGAGKGRLGPEVKRFLDTRKPARPETVQVFLVLRNVP